MKYLKGLATDISKAHEHLTKAQKSNIAEAFKAQFVAQFKAHVRDLNAMRKRVERGMASGKLTWDVLKEAKEAVRNFHLDKEMLEKSIGVYDKERASPKKKAKQKATVIEEEDSDASDEEED